MNVIDEFRIISEEDVSLFNEPNAEYVIPLYQRAFSWTDIEIEQLIDDINDFKEERYYLGSLIVNKMNNDNVSMYEVIDGQQRLTALSLILIYLNHKIDGKLSFQCRDKSNLALKLLNSNKDLSSIRDNYDDVDETIIDGYAVVCRKMNGIVDKEHFKNQLKKVVIYRILVPSGIDLNKYFEIMNTRGEQLEQHDILKAELLGYLKDDNERFSMSLIWDACSDMNGYVQMHFDKKNRETLFGSSWNAFPDFKFLKINDINDKSFTIEKIISYNNINSIIHDNDVIDSDVKDDHVRFESIITFPYFLIHVLKVLVYQEKIESDIGEIMDDKRLLEIFRKVIECQNDCLLFTRTFMKYLIKTRFLFDKYIIKREFQNDNSDGIWSLKDIHTSGQQSLKKSYYKNTESLTRYTNGNQRFEELLKLQSCLRVSYTSPKIMHWLTKALIYLYSNGDNINCINYIDCLESYVKESIRKQYLNLDSSVRFNMGVDTPHIVFNYIDYLLWKKDKKIYKDFNFEFRNSVEHWYPRNPSEGTFEEMYDVDGLNSLGNLCLIQRKLNSKFSNLSPCSKKDTFEKMISKGSLKLRMMSNLTKDNSDWKNKQCKIHGFDMYELLERECSN